MLQNEQLQNILKRRAKLLANVRRFFSVRNVLEVNTPILSSAAPTALYLDSFSTRFEAGSDSKDLYLHTSPEFAMKRLLAAGSGAIYQIATVFRNGELGRQHAPEFSMLEWYRPGFSLTELMTEVDALIQQVIGLPSAVIFPYRDLFAKYLQLDIYQTDDVLLKQIALDRIAGLTADWQTDRDGWLEMLMSEVIEPQLKALEMPVMVTEFPASQAQLAKIEMNTEGHPVANRFELYAGGMELANGYDELCDATELRQRFEQDNQLRLQQGKPQMPIDENLLTAMQSGLPQCSGVALGLDRLMMLHLGEKNINQVQSIAFIES
ncbi:EF-P lysine aminoacylase EpmA [Methylophaga nitratireducenticrescens]|uniref:Translation elongation factor P Lys34:lysine transferase n=1 Tax=Methylophaga nitratireducenticrescens TaxID=754476 RepID=I1XMI3_METNJ|nr:EF-P lysine aminoacylase EpmA [Methylophaga nitratireducenticrescens]AFI85602.1 EF-P lysine aminoacylase GenX [Methylophaga nitratireducenticrescens]AUZ85335.1 EF-P lysine aminoacylase GenX [Methylophaga nitratireducenticrescens]